MPTRTSLTSARAVADPAASSTQATSSAAESAPVCPVLGIDKTPLDRVGPRFFQYGAAARRQPDRTAGLVINAHQAVDDRVLPHRQPRTGAVPRFHGRGVGPWTIRHPGEELQHD